MKKLFSVFTAVLTVALAGSSIVLAMASYSSSLSGRQATQRTEGKVRLSAQSSGDLPGTLDINVSHNADGTVSGGDWELMVTNNSDGSRIGTLTGTVGSGAVVLDGDDWVSSGNFQLNVTRGTGAYSSIASGTGNVQGNVDRESRTPFDGQLTLNF